MKQEEVFKKIGGIIREINEQYEYLETTGGVHNDLELELLIANAHFLSDHIEILRKINNQLASLQHQLPPSPAIIENTPAPAVEEIAPLVLPQSSPEPRFFEPVTAEEPEAEDEPVGYIDETPNAHVFEFEMPKPAEDHTYHFPDVEEEAENELEAEPEAFTPEPEVVTAEPETIRHELTLEDIGEDWDEEETDPEDIEIPEPVMHRPEPAPVITEEPEPEPVIEEPETAPEPVATTPEPIKQPEPQPEHIAAATPDVKPKPAESVHTQIMVPEDQVLTLNQRMSAQMSTSRMSDHLGAQPISDLKSAISLNDKLMYIKDLFNGYGLAYSEAIDRLNRMQSFEEAESFLRSNYATKNHWDEKAATADKFFALLQRRYN